MKTTKIEVKAKGTDNIQKSLTIFDVPETLEEIVGATPTNQTERAMSYFIAGMEASAKSRLEHGETITYAELLKRSGRRTQSGLIQSIMGLVPRAAMATPSLVGDLVNLQSLVMSDYKGKADQYYSRYQELYNAVVQAEDD